MKTQSILLAAMLSLVGAAASAQTSAVDQVKKDNAVIRQDTKEIRNDNRDINKDNAGIRNDRRDINQDQRALNNERRERNADQFR